MADVRVLADGSRNQCPGHCSGLRWKDQPTGGGDHSRVGKLWVCGPSHAGEIGPPKLGIVMLGIPVALVFMLVVGWIIHSMSKKK